MDKIPCIPVLESSKACVKLTSEGKLYPWSLLLGCKEWAKIQEPPIEFEAHSPTGPTDLPCSVSLYHF